MDRITRRRQLAANVRAECARRTPPTRQADLAAALGISQQAMSRRLTGDVPFDVDEIQVLAARFGVSAAVLLGEPATAAS